MGAAQSGRRPAAVIYTHSLLEGSMTFIKSQAEALVRFVPVYAGAHRVNGIELPPERTHVVNRGTPLGVVEEALFRLWGSAPRLVAALEKHAPRIVHVHFGTCGPAGMALARALGIPLLVTFHGQDATTDRQEAMRTHRGREYVKRKDEMIRFSGGFIAVSEYIRQRLLADGYPAEKVRVHRNGIDLDYFAPEPATERRPLIVFVGRFVEKKGVRYLIEAAAQLKAANVEFELVIIGGGPLETQLRAAAAAARIRCRFTGFLAPGEVRDWMRRASVVAIPSVTAANGDSEGLPTTLLEAQAVATPVVATRHSGIPEGMVDGETGDLVDERDVTALAQRLRVFLESPARVHAAGDAGRRFVARHFDMKTQVAGLEEIYLELIRREGRDAEAPWSRR
jgi:glycosyltransferase involved in cell wall biosynthesis